MAGKFELYRDKAGEFRFRLKASNGQIILTSEGYKTKASAEQGVASVRKNAADAKRFTSKPAAGGKFMFVLTATNGQTVGQSQSYDSETTRDAGIASVQAHAPDAATDDQTAAAT